jgi:hypothetical protein
MKTMHLSVTIKKEEVLAKLRSNLVQHQKDYKAARKGFRLEVLEHIKDLQKDIKDDPDGFEVSEELADIRPPKSQEEEYKRAIQMLEMCVEKTVELDANQFESFIQNKWTWTNDWALSNSCYIERSIKKGKR